MSDKIEIEWLDEPGEHNYPAALSYLSLIYNEQKSCHCLKKLKRSRISEFKAKDILGHQDYRCSVLVFRIEKD